MARKTSKSNNETAKKKQVRGIKADGFDRSAQDSEYLNLRKRVEASTHLRGRVRFLGHVARARFARPHCSGNASCPLIQHLGHPRPPLRPS